MILALAVALMGFATAVATNIIDARERRELRAEHQTQLATEQARVTDLIRQMQLNAQSLPHYPSIGPIESEPERRYLSDDTGLIVGEFDPADDDDFADVSG